MGVVTDPQELAANAKTLPHGVAFAAAIEVDETAVTGDTVYVMSLIFQVADEGKTFKQTFLIDEELALLMGLDNANAPHQEQDTPPT
ncbi:MAG: hypothetical protein V3U14_12890 [candidate division NC10 bacterium]